MCIRSYVHFSKCAHLENFLTPCPTYHKQQESARGFFGSIFRRSLRKKETCGKVVPHHVDNETYCQACAIRRDNFAARSVGKGALKVRKQGIEEILHEEAKEAARRALRKAERGRRGHGSEEPRHQVVHAETSVWLGDLYRHPDTLGRRDAYAREAARAPPVSSSSRRTLKKRPTNQPPSSTAAPTPMATTETRPKPVDPIPSRERTRDRRPREHNVNGQGEGWMPAYGDSQPIARPARPAPTHQHAGRPANHTNHVNQVTSRSQAAGYSSQTQRDPRSFAVRAEATGYPELRHKTGHIHRTLAVARANEPAQAYSSRQQAYAGEEARTEAARVRRVVTPPQEIVFRGPRPYWQRTPSRWDARKASFSSWVSNNRASTPLDEGSDVSFVCHTSKAISDRQRAT